MGAAVAGKDIRLVHEYAKRAKTLRRFRSRRHHFQMVHADFGDHGARPARGCHGRFAAWLAAGVARVRARFPHLGKLESGHREVWCAAGNLRHAAHLLHRHADRRSHQPRHRNLSDRDFSRAAAPADWHRHRAAGGHPEHHLWHLGPVRVRALVPGARAAADDRYASPTFQCSTSCSPVRLTASAC